MDLCFNFFQALTYCDLKCVHMGGLVEVLRLYPEYQQQFANDIQHDLTFNLREGYECHDSDIGPTFPLPSISEDDENQPEVENNEDEVDFQVCTDTTVSPHHSITTPSPLHARSPLLTVNSPRLLKSYRKGRSLITLRERVERQRSVNVTSSVDTTSLEEDFHDNDNDTHNIEHDNHKNLSLERLDYQVNTLHQDMTQLSFEVRNALQALQEMSIPKNIAHTKCKFLPTRSIPNISTAYAPVSECRSTSNTESPLQRCSSHPPQIWWREMEEQVRGNKDTCTLTCTNTTYDFPNELQRTSRACQTDVEIIDYRKLEEFVVSNPQMVLSLLSTTMGLKTDNIETQATFKSPLRTIKEKLDKISYDDSYHDDDQTADFNLNMSFGSCCPSTEALLQVDRSLSPAPMHFSYMINDSEKLEYSKWLHRSNDNSSSSSNNTQTSSQSIVHVPSANKLKHIHPFQFLTTKQDNFLSGEYQRLHENESEPTIKYKQKCSSLWCIDNGSPHLSIRNSILSRHQKATPNRAIHRFSAGDADILEKGLCTLPSARLLRESISQ